MTDNSKINPITFKKATLTTDDQTIEGILVVSNEDKLPKEVFVPIGKTLLYTNNAIFLNEILEKCKDKSKSDMLEMMTVADLPIPHIDDYFFDENSGLLINFFQKAEDQRNSKDWENSPVFIQLIDPIEWLNDWDGDKKIWIKAMLNKNPPEELKNKLLVYEL